MTGDGLPPHVVDMALHMEKGDAANSRDTLLLP
jgi:hypothetical protein